MRAPRLVQAVGDDGDELAPTTNLTPAAAWSLRARRTLAA
jgi:hypothetical protein